MLERRHRALAEPWTGVGGPLYCHVMAGTPTGHIEQLPSGSWRAKVYAGTDPLTGREIRFRRTCKTERAAQIELGKLLAMAQAGRQQPRVHRQAIHRAPQHPGP